MRTLLVLRHAETEHTRPGSTDHARRLTPLGRQQAADLGDWLRENGVGVDRVLCSSATRARQTFEALELVVPEDRIEISDDLYDAGADTVVERVRELDDATRHVLVVGHAPTLPSVVHELADRAASDPAALAAIDRRYPPCTLSVLSAPDPWVILERATLTAVYLP